MTAQNLRSGAWLTRRRANAYLRIFAIANVIGFALAICRAEGWFIPAYPHFATEFLSFFSAGRLVDAGNAAAVYAPGIPAHAFIPSFNIPPAHGAMGQALTHDRHIMYFSFFYPPVYLLLCAPLAHLPYYVAYVLWVGLTGLLLAICLRLLAGGWARLWPAFAYLAIIENAAVGENAFLSAALTGFGLLNIEARPVLAGICFGGLCYKPHFMLPVVLFLLIGRHSLALLSTILTSTALCAVSAALFGWENWVTYFSVTVPHAEWVFAHAGVSYALQVTPGSAVRLLGGGMLAATLVQGCGMVFAFYCLFITRKASLNLRAAMLCASFPMLLSLMLGYDLTLCGLAILFMLREAGETGYRDYEKTALAAMFALPLVTEVLRTQLHIPLDPLIPAALMLLLARRAEPAAMSAMSRVLRLPA